MIRTLGVLAAVTVLCLGSWAQLPGEKTQVGPQYPRASLTGSYSYGMTQSFNSGHIARPNGWNASLDLNVAKWMGFVFEGGGLYGTSKIPTDVPDPFPHCTGNDPSDFCPGTTPTFNVDTKLYSYMLGARFPYRKSERFTPFAEALFGHSGVRGEALSNDGRTFAVVSGGLGLIGGGGVDYNISPRWALRFRVDYMQTRLFNKKQDNGLFSVGIVIRTVRKKKKTLEDIDQTQP